MKEELILMHEDYKMRRKIKFEIYFFALGRHGQRCVFIVFFRNYHNSYGFVEGLVL